MDTREANPFVARQLERLFDIERDIIRLYAECCYAGIQGTCGNPSYASRVEALDADITDACDALRALKQDLSRLGVPREAMISLDDFQKLDIFEAQFKEHEAFLSGHSSRFDRAALDVMLKDIASADGD